MLGEAAPNHQVCDMPQELRDPRFRTGHFSFKVAKAIEMAGIISSQSIIMRNATQLAIDAFWPDARAEDVQLILLACGEMDKAANPAETKFEGTKLIGKTMLFGDN